MGDITIDEKLDHLEAELKSVQKIREDLFSKIEELELADAKMSATSEAFKSQIDTLQELKASQPELI
jgi:uncharacterized protein YlxW (UPF0749 family)